MTAIQLRLIWEVCRKDLRLFWADRRGVLLCFTVPIVLASLFGLIFRNSSQGHLESFKAGLVVCSDTPLSAAVVQALKGQSLLEIRICTLEEAENLLATREIPVALVLPHGFGADTGTPGAPTPGVIPQVISANGNEMQARLAEGILSEAVVRQTSERFMASLTSMGIPGIAGIAERFNDLGRVERVNASAGSRDQAVFGHSFCGMTLQYLLFLGMDCGLLLLRERHLGIWRRLTISPAFPGTLMTGRALATTLIALAQISITFSFARLVFGVTIEGSVPGFLAMAVSVACLAASTGLLVAAVGGSESRARSVAILVILSLSMLGGLWLPPFLMPGWLRALGMVLPTSWALAGLEAASWQGGSLETALVHALVVLLFSLAFLGLAFIGFQRSQKRMDLKGGTT